MINRRAIRFNNSGFSLLELVVVLAIVGTLLTISTIAFHNWMRKSRVEAQIQQMMADINSTRLRAMTSKQRHSIVLDADKYAFRSYSSEAESIDNGRLISNPTDVRFRLKKDATTNFTGERYEFDQRGILQGIGNVMPILIEYEGDAAKDCLNLQGIRVTAGKRSGDVCNEN